MIDVKDLRKTYHRGVLKKTETCAVDNISFHIRKGECYGLIGESGCGKTTLGKLLLRLIEPDSGTIMFDGMDLLALNRRELREQRRRMQMIFQDPTGSLNPCMRIGESVGEALKVRGVRDRKKREEETLSILKEVGLHAEFVNRYPYQMSGGQIQRVVLARVVALEPRFIIADEATSALDVAVQAQILDLMKNLQKEYQLTCLFISHDLEVVEHMCDNVAVMMDGHIVENASVKSIFKNPGHQYTKKLVSASYGSRKESIL